MWLLEMENKSFLKDSSEYDIKMVSQEMKTFSSRFTLYMTLQFATIFKEGFSLCCISQYVQNVSRIGFESFTLNGYINYGTVGKFVQYEIYDFCLCRPGFYVPDISDSSRTVLTFVQVVHAPATNRLVGRSNKILTLTTSICRRSQEFPAE